ncbi:hypothetical protein ACH5RR_028050 [Cinchona calisaya]|uniref:Transcription factor TFIIIC triple barrel domain-containing protein n=1 Tax=Cinchona calisaya TaxID=153742 RepID=A0ABD2YMM3_9GENT
MEDNNISRLPQEEEEEEEEYVLMNLDAVTDQVHIPPNAPYILSGLDTLNPILTIDEKIKLIGEYEETIGTCLVFTESDATPVLHQETGPSETNLISGTCIVDNKQTLAKQVKPMTRLHKILKFRLLQEADIIMDKQTNEVNDSTDKQTKIVSD